MKIIITADGRNLAATTGGQPLTSGSVGIEAAFILSADYADLAVTAVFSAGETRVDVLLTTPCCIVPWEVLQEPQATLFVGVVGKNGSGEIVIPTVWGRVGMIQCGAVADGLDPQDPTPDLAAQLLEQARDALAEAEETKEATAQSAQDAADDADRAEAAKQAVEDLGVTAHEDPDGPNVEKAVDPKTGAVTLDFGFKPAGVTEVNGQTGEVSLDLDDLPDGALYARTTPAQVQQIGTNKDGIDAIEDLIPNQATPQNQLADKDFVNSSINSSAAFFRGAFPTHTALFAVAWQTTDPTASNYVSNNDYAYVANDETHDGEAWRYLYVLQPGGAGNGWQPQFRVNESPLTAEQLAAINSGATAENISSIARKYELPGTGMPEADLAQDVKAKLNLADTALQPAALAAYRTAAAQDDIDDALSEQISLLNGKRYGVSGIGQSAAALTRLWDAIGMTAQVGTDGDNSNVVNDFDNAAPFMRRKCVGKWHLIEGKPVFRPNAYFGDADYAEDGSMGDYVAVECPRAYYYFKDGTLGVSDRQHPGWRPFDIFCRNHNPQDTLEYAYLPAYALAKDANGKAVSLPGYDNVQGSYKDIMDACRTYDGDAASKAHAQPMAVNFYEWALFTVEFATQNCQSIMQGCAGLRHNSDDRATLRADGKWLLNNYQPARVVGEYVSIQLPTVDINAAAYYASHKIKAITRCDAEGNASASGAYQLVETEDLGLNREYTVGDSYRFAARPYRTGDCNSVSTPSGSPVSNSDSYHPMKYRWRENVYSNQYKTIADLFNKKVGTDDNDWMLEWYYLPDPSSYVPSTQSKPDATDLETDAFVLLNVETAHADYVNGYVKSKKYSGEFPDIWIPYETSGGSASTYFCDYAYLVYSYVVRACRVGGYWYSGALAGFSFLLGLYAPSSASAYSGGDLFFPQ